MMKRVITVLEKNLVEGYYINGKLHRTDGPAFIQYDNNGLIAYESFYFVDRYYQFLMWIETVKDEISKEKYDELVRRYGGKKM